MKSLLPLFFAFFATNYNEVRALISHLPISSTSIVTSTTDGIVGHPRVQKQREPYPFSMIQRSHRPKSGSFPPSDLPQPASRRTFIVLTYSFGLIAGGLVGVGMNANAKYGESSNLELPSYIDYLIEKNTQRDTTTALYQGVDATTLLKRLSDAETRLEQVPELTRQQKWTQINGLVTGPLGTLSVTLNQIVSVPTATSKTKDVVKKIKADVLGIGQAAAKKNADDCNKKAALASQDLKTLLQEAFE